MNYIEKIKNKLKENNCSEASLRTIFENELNKTIIKYGFNVIQETKVEGSLKRPDFEIKKDNGHVCFIETKIPSNKILNTYIDSIQIKNYTKLSNTNIIILTNYKEIILLKNNEILENIDLENESIENIFNNPVFRLENTKQNISINNVLKELGIISREIRDFIKDKEEIKYFKNLWSRHIKKNIDNNECTDNIVQTIVFKHLLLFLIEDVKEVNEGDTHIFPIINEVDKYITGFNKYEKFKYLKDKIISYLNSINKEYLYKNNNREYFYIYLFEEYLKEYNPDLRKKLGAYYTPDEAVNYVIKITDLLLKKHFNINGLLNKDVHILEPAMGTGAFIKEIFNFVIKEYEKIGIVYNQSKIHHNLFPRINGFEITLSSYLTACLRMLEYFKKYGFKEFTNIRLFLTDTLSNPLNIFESINEDETALCEITQKINEIKKIPFDVIIGNPPYGKGNGFKKGHPMFDSIQSLKYKDEVSVFHRFQDISLVFIKYSVDKLRDKGIVSFILPNTILMKSSCRSLRKYLYENFLIYIVNLHGQPGITTQKTSKDDENIFLINQAVCMMFIIKGSDTKKVFYKDMIGTKESKLKNMMSEDFIQNDSFKEINVLSPYYMFDFDNDKKKNQRFKSGINRIDLYKLTISPQPINQTYGNSIKDVIKRMSDVKCKIELVNEKYIIPIMFSKYNILYSYIYKNNEVGSYTNLKKVIDRTEHGDICIVYNYLTKIVTHYVLFETEGHPLAPPQNIKNRIQFFRSFNQ